MNNRKDMETVENPKGIFRTTMAYTKGLMLCQFNMKQGARVPLHNHPAEQAGYVVSGKIKFIQEDDEYFIAESGCGYAFGPMEFHGAEVLEDSEVIESFSPARDEYK